MNSIPGSAVSSLVGRYEEALRLLMKNCSDLPQIQHSNNIRFFSSSSSFFRCFSSSLYFMVQYEYVVQIRLHRLHRARTYAIMFGCCFFLSSSSADLHSLQWYGCACCYKYLYTFICGCSIRGCVCRFCCCCISVNVQCSTISR